MDEVPVIIHRLSQRLWVPEYREREDKELAQNLQDPSTKEKPVDPLASPPQDPVDVSGRILDASQIASLSLDSGSEMHALFSQKNLLRLGALTDSHKTLSLFTPSIRDTVFRAWAGPTERGEMSGISGRATPVTPALTRAHSYTGNSSTTYSFTETSEAGKNTVRPGISSFGSAASGLGHNSSKQGKSHGGRKRKHRIVNLRKKPTNADDVESVSAEGSTASGTLSSAPSEFGARPSTPQNREKDELVTPPSTPEQSRTSNEPGDGTPLKFRNFSSRPPPIDYDATPRASMHEACLEDNRLYHVASDEKRPRLRSSQALQPLHLPEKKKAATKDPTISQSSFRQLSPSPYVESVPENAKEHPWMTRLADEIARKIQDQKAKDGSFWDSHEREDNPPPAYRA